MADAPLVSPAQMIQKRQRIRRRCLSQRYVPLIEEYQEPAPIVDVAANRRRTQPFSDEMFPQFCQPVADVVQEAVLLSYTSFRTAEL